MLKVKAASFIQTRDKIAGFVRIGLHAVAIDNQESIGDGKRRALIAVNERVILRQAFRSAAASSGRPA